MKDRTEESGCAGSASAKELVGHRDLENEQQKSFEFYLICMKNIFPQTGREM